MDILENSISPPNLHYKNAIKNEPSNVMQAKKLKKSSGVRNNFPYEVKLAAPEYHIVRNRNSLTIENSLAMVRNRTTLTNMNYNNSTVDL